MDNFRTPKHFLFTEGKEELHLHTIFTRLGQKTVYDSAAQCNKCAYCSRVCPAQLDTAREDKGPRARNILLRLIMEGKIDRRKNISKIKDVLSGCMLCGLCTKECFAKVPTHEHVLELERVYGPRKPPLKITALSKRNLRTETKNFDLGGKEKFAFFLPSFEARYPETESALGMLRAVKKICGGANILRQECAVYKYVYSSLPAARKAARKLIEEYFGVNPAGDKKIITDSLDIFNFVKKYPQLFWETGDYEKAQRFASNILFIADILPNLQKIKDAGKIIFNKTAAFCAEDKIFESSVNLLSKSYKADFCHAWEGENYPVPPLGYGHIKPQECARYLRRKAEFIAAAQADIIVCPDLSQKRSLNKTLKKYYPKCKAVFIGDLYADKQTDR